MSADNPTPNRTNQLLVVALILVSGVALWLGLSRPDPTAPVQAPSSAPAPSTPSPVVETPDTKEPPAPIQREPEVVHPFSIEGLIADPSGQSIVGARLDVIGPTGVVASVHSELDGSFRTGGLPLDLYEVRATATGYDRTTARRVSPGGPSLQLVLARGETLRGRVFKLDGSPAANAAVHIGGPGIFPQHFVATDSAGAFEISGLREGDIQFVVLTAKEGSPFPLRASIQQGVEPLEVRLMPGFSLTTTITGDGRAVEGALVTVSNEALHVLALQDSTDATGKVRFDGLVPGTYYIDVRASGFLAAPPQPISLPSSGPVPIALSRGARVKGEVRATNGDPVPLAQIVAHVETPRGATWRIDGDTSGLIDDFVRPDGSRLPSIEKRFLTDASGAFDVSGLPPGKVRLEAIKDGWIPERMLTFSLEHAGLIEEAGLTMSRGTQAAGRVLGPGDVPIPDAQVRWRLGSEAFPWRGDVRTDSKGSFHFDAIARDVVLEVQSQSFATLSLPFSFDIAQGPYENVELRLQSTEGAILGRLVGPAGPIAGGEVSLADDVGATQCRGETDRRGVFRLNECGQSAHIFTLRGPSVAPAWAEIRAGDEVELLLKNGATLHARLIDASTQQPIPQAALKISAEVPLVRGQGVHLWRHEVGLFDGLLDLSYLPAGPVQLNIQADGYAQWSVHHSLEDDQRLDLGVISLTPLRKLSGAVIDNFQAPIKDVLVTIDGSAQKAVTDAQGRFQLASVNPGQSVVLRASHWRAGQGRATLSPTTEDLVIELNEPIGGAGDAWAQRLSRDHVTLRRNKRGWIVSEISPDSVWYALGLRTGDALEVLSPREGDSTVEQLVLARGGERRTLYRPQ